MKYYFYINDQQNAAPHKLSYANSRGTSNKQNKSKTLVMNAAKKKVAIHKHSFCLVIYSLLQKKRNTSFIDSRKIKQFY
ncbi:hypothetical protein AsAng_0043220 [Aureispira anguillae]|uniref:Uncharacterized protein n=1 Tax=Aureispira anguillae TaxID=2864201 RepID=A0A915YIA0_9BACT|nr:hypothetical protein AsAng_0043220 [Aureispira anguillae]